ncbi:MAG TPA: hypothetical protein VEK15_14445 [Vicinamibacteria bacterium]|nr:hypothetical protein [Vicinamibacteria bacterium]
MHREIVEEVGEQSELALRILDYFRRHPNAKDSVEGIARFWVGADPMEVRRVLDKLVNMKLVDRRENTSMDLYSVGPEAI